MALGISIRRQTGGLAPYRLTFTRCTLLAACLGKRGSFSIGTRLPPTNVCWPNRSSICCIWAPVTAASSWDNIRTSSSADGFGFSGMPPLFRAWHGSCFSSSRPDELAVVTIGGEVV
jgi:hypothetical protein